MTRQYGRGKWLTRCGIRAVVARIRNLGPNEWILDGAVLCQSDGTFQMTSWKLDGRSELENFDLVSEGWG